MLSREYYLDDKESKYKDAYLKYMISIAELLGANHSHAVSEMNAVLDFEIKLANVSIKMGNYVDPQHNGILFRLCLMGIGKEPVTQ